MADENPIYNPGSPAEALAAATAPLPKPEKLAEPTPSEPPKPTEHKSSLKTLRTFQGDVQEAVGKGNISMTTIAIAEQQRKTLRPDLEQPTDHENIQHKLMLIVGGLLLTLGLITLGAVYYNSRTETQVAINNKTATPIVFSQETQLPIFATSTRTELLGEMIAHKQSFKLPVNSVLYINTTEGKNTAPVENVLNILTPQIPPALARSFDEKYMMGIYSFDTNEPFLIFTTSDYGSTYAGMLEWEKTMISDLGRLFNITKPASTSPYIFEDESLRNKDLRVVKDNKRQTILLYSFIDKNTVVITSRENILTGILGKYVTSKMSR